MFKKLLKFTAISITCLTITQICYASSDDISVILNGSKLDFEVKPQIINGSTYVPMRTIFEKLGATVSWDDSTKTVTGIKEDTTVKLKIGENKVTVNNKDIILNSGATIINGRTLVPVRAVAESFDCTVDWDTSTNCVKIESLNNNSNKSLTFKETLSPPTKDEIIGIWKQIGEATPNGDFIPLQEPTTEHPFKFWFEHTYYSNGTYISNLLTQYLNGEVDQDVSEGTYEIFGDSLSTTSIIGHEKMNFTEKYLISPDKTKLYHYMLLNGNAYVYERQ